MRHRPVRAVAAPVALVGVVLVAACTPAPAAPGLPVPAATPYPELQARLVRFRGHP